MTEQASSEPQWTRRQPQNSEIATDVDSHGILMSSIIKKQGEVSLVKAHRSSERCWVRIFFFYKNYIQKNIFNQTIFFPFLSYPLPFPKYKRKKNIYKTTEKISRFI